MKYTEFNKSRASFKRILVVDDQPDNLFLLQELLEEEGYSVECTNNGQDALNKLTESPPDLLLLDLGIPEMDGYEVIQRIQKDTYLPFIPIILMTAHGARYAIRGLEIGAHGCVCLPFDINDLLAKIKILLELKQTVAQQQQPA
ncbi:hypothetical protein C7B76_29635 [filamentous cyanobacterium CCP2]|nr:hypothetical protein C7B76_29635 [filamentous cyanobacterium CCP2]